MLIDKSFLSLSFLVDKGHSSPATLPDSDGSKDSSLESNEFRSYGRHDSTFLKEVNI